MDTFYSNFTTYQPTSTSGSAATATARPENLATMMRVPLPLSGGVVQHSPQPLITAPHHIGLVGASFEGGHTTNNEKVKHDYHDHANDAAAGDYDTPSASSSSSTNAAAALLSGGPGSGMDQSFPMKLHYMLNDIEQDGLAHIVSWQPHGRCFVVHNQKLFVERILGSYFRQSKIASFQRQLNIYGFQRLTAGPDKGGYYHELFLRTKPGLAAHIQRFKLKGTKTRKAANPESEPNFYAMEPLPNNKDTKQPEMDNSATAKAAPPSSILNALRDNGIMVGSGRNLTLKKLAPSLFSPDIYETTTMHQMNSGGPLQYHMSGGRQGLTVTSSSSLSLKPTHNDYMNDSSKLLTSSMQQSSNNTGALPSSMTSRFQQGQANNNRLFMSAAGGNGTGSNDPLWTALGASAGGGTLLPFSLSDYEAGFAAGASSNQNSSTSKWMLR